MKNQLIVWTLAAAAFGLGYLLYDMYTSLKEDCYKQPYVSSTLCATERR
jgi:hypothetical protein